MNSAEFNLEIDGQLFGGWQEISIERGIERMAGAFEIGFTEKWPGTDTPRPIRPGASCRALIDGETVLTGHVDDLTIDRAADRHSLRVTGRDAAADMWDCAANPLGPFEYTNLTLPWVVRALADPFGVPVSTSAGLDLDRPIERFAIQPGETAWEAIERACRMQAVLPISDGLGGLLLTRAGGAAGGALGAENIKSGSGSWSWKDRFAETFVRGQQEGSDNIDAGSAAGPMGRARDGQITRYRPTVIMAENAGDEAGLNKRAEWESRVARGRGLRAEYELAGWRNGAGALWRPNTMIKVSDPWLNLDASLLLVSVKFSRSESAGTITRMTLAPRDAFDLIADETGLAEPTDDGGWGGGWWEPLGRQARAQEAT